MLELAVHTVGGVIKPGDTVADIVPEKDPLILEALVHPRDIDRLNDATPARIRFTSFNSKTTPELNGHVTSIAADQTIQAENAPPMFRA